MDNNDSNLIQRTLEGDQQAFASLVEKYQDQIHALAWQKIGDYHIAQEITQDTFIKAYQELATLKHPNRLAGWLYVITTNNCNMWHRKKKLQTQSLEETNPTELEELSYLDHIIREREEVEHEQRRSLVKELLSKLSESDRTVITLHYLAGMSCEEIGKFLGIKTNTVKSRLHRARNRLRQEEAMIQENLSSFQLPKQLTENIMDAISNLTPKIPIPKKPIMPWLLSSASAIFIFIILGTSVYHIYHFQKPYSLNSTSQKTIEITEAKQVIDASEKPDKRNLIAKSTAQNTDNNLSENQNSQLVDPTNLDDAPNHNNNKNIQTGTVSLSGIVVDATGKLVQGLQLTIKPMKINDLGRIDELTPRDTWKKVVTDNKGTFSFENIDPVASQLMMLPESRSIYEITSIKIGDLTYHSTGNKQYTISQYGQDDYPITLSIDSDTSLENIVVTVTPVRRIRGRILLRNGKPLANKRVKFHVEAGERDTFLGIFTIGWNGGIQSGFIQTDSQGYYVINLGNVISTDYRVSMNYYGATAKSKWFQLDDGHRKDNLDFRLRNIKKVQEKTTRKRKQRDVWSVNPHNGHAYKKILVESWEDAKEKAKSEKAYLVAINDETEQKWIEARFPEYQFYWIGLQTNNDGTPLQWTNGEDLTYVNWLSTKEASTPNTPVALDFHSKRWMKIDSNNKFSIAIKHAIIEKDNIKIKSK